MKVRELIKQLEKLEQDKNIWVLYYLVAFLEPKIDIVGPDDSESKQGDYYFMAW